MSLKPDLRLKGFQAYRVQMGHSSDRIVQHPFLSSLLVLLITYILLYKILPPPQRASNKAAMSINNNDVVVAVMGVTGCGKSSFIKKVTGRSDVKVGDSLTSGKLHSLYTVTPANKLSRNCRGPRVQVLT